ncbi:hypothetical protein AgCh_032337 [Apium graveolens]
MQNYVALGAVMGKLNIPLPPLPEDIRPELPTPLLILVTKTKGEIEARIQQFGCVKANSKEPIQVGQRSSSAQVDVGKERFLKAAEGPNQDQEISKLLTVLRMSLQNNYMTYKKALAKNINFIRAAVVKIDNFLEKRIVVNINDGGVDRCLQVSLPNIKTLRASELDVMINRINPVIPEDTQLLHELKNAWMANPLYIQILKNGPFTPMVRVEESTYGDKVISAHYAPKDPSEYTEPEKMKVNMDSGLQLILIESLDNNISAIREGRYLSRITLEVLYGILKIFKLEMIQRKSLRTGQGHVVDGSSALIVNEIQTSNDEPISQTPLTSTSEQRTIDSQEQVILELEEDEFYILDELNELDQSMDYLARNFSNIRVKKPRFFKGKGQSFKKDRSWKGKGKYTSESKNGYKTGSVDISKIRCFKYDELGHFARECRKPKKVKKEKAYLELEAKYEALLKKQQNLYCRG